MKKYTILHTIETGGTGGAETIFLTLVTHLDRERFNHVVMLPCDGWLRSKIEAAGVPTVVAGSRAWYDPRHPAVMAGLVMKAHVDLIHSHLPDENFYACLAGKLTGRMNVTTYHGAVDLALAREGLKQRTKHWIARKWSTVAVAVCDDVARLLIDMGFPSERVVRIYNGIDTTRFENAVAGRFRAEIGCSNGTKVISMVANANAWKGYEVFIKAAQSVAKRVPTAKFFAVGEVNQDLSADLHGLVERLNLQKHFTFLGFREDVPEILRDSDLFVLSSLSEGLPLVTLEAMSAGTPVVGTSCGGQLEVVRDGVSGVLVPPGDANALADNIIGLLGDPARGRKMAQAARAVVRDKFSVDAMVRNYEALYDRLLN